MVLMFTFVIAIVLVIICLMSVALRKTYSYVPIRELKRQARHGDPLAQVLYSAAAYGTNLNLLLWAIIAVSGASSFILLAHIAPSWLAFLAVASIMLYGFAWLPSARLTGFGARVAMWLTPGVLWVLRNSRPVLERITRLMYRHRSLAAHTELYEAEDLQELLERQKAQTDSRIPHETLDLLLHALTFGDRHVHDVLVPRRTVRMVNAQETVSASFMDELHTSGHSRFPVFSGSEDHLVGTLYMRDLVNAKQSGKVEHVMRPDVYYVHEDHSLEQALHAFLRTKHHLFIVVNGFEEYVGIITIEDVLEQVIGHKIIDEFDHYEDLRAVAAHAAQKDHNKHKKQEVPEDAPAVASENTIDADEPVS
jgi:CBS domain containing-hemolysin-like protein